MTTEELIAEIAAQIAQDFEDQLSDRGIESPIEQVMAAGLLYVMRKYFSDEEGRNDLSYVFPESMSRFENLSEDRFRTWFGGHGFQIQPQFHIGKYCADFFVDYLAENGAHVMAVIECDGHDFHERTKRQAQHDKERDRYFQSLGLLVLRFTGSEIWANPIKAARAALTLVHNRARGLT